MKTLVIGAVTVDIIAVPNKTIIYGDSNPGKIYKTFGGVSKNIVENLARLGFDVDFVFNVGNDTKGKEAIAYLQSLNVNPIFKIYNQPTDTYLSVFDESKELMVAINDMSCVQHINASYIESLKLNPNDYDLVICDMNMATETLSYVLKTFKNVYIEGVSANKIVKLKPILNSVQALKANFLEACTLFEVETLEEVIAKLKSYNIREAIITLGKEGSLVFLENKIYQVPSQPTNVINVSGAGDAFLAGYLYAKFLENNTNPYDQLISGSCASLITLHSPLTNSLDLNQTNLNKEILLWKSKS
ncbi:PfkB family carbohydrate kinase [Ureaplasma miroungigenitalium]|uniref:PfkB family carbohydrate kinase n=1 Tax=Ureaplasma miroungigenitalium TaxID=1042321 RepID=A0ABT3BN20_9BACT|nr:PfkB family carbohydrate kinase [Ureaplasma miroungigenitalium]MCV3728633.1 PfkB family carbohydrate kinase [Ureaplasma miroungigenitalium]MCV3734324.1 PfkB family carbohydrate kinase [Ureaplasma miroungigenitalium]